MRRYREGQRADPAWSGGTRALFPQRLGRHAERCRRVLRPALRYRLDCPAEGGSRRLFKRSVKDASRPPPPASLLCPQSRAEQQLTGTASKGEAGVEELRAAQSRG